jgi:hypothetical protein
MRADMHGFQNKIKTDQNCSEEPRNEKSQICVNDLLQYSCKIFKKYYIFQKFVKNILYV